MAYPIETETHLIEVNDSYEGLRILKLPERLGYENDERFKQELHRYENDANQDITIAIDFSGTECISSGCWGKLTALHKRQKSRGNELIVFGLNSEIDRMFRIFNFDKLFTICSNEDEVLASRGVKK